MVRWHDRDGTMTMTRYNIALSSSCHRSIAPSPSCHRAIVIVLLCHRVITIVSSCHYHRVIVLSWHRLPVWQSDMMTDTTPCVRASINNNNYCLWTWYSLQFWLYLNQTYTVVRYPWELGSFRKPVRFAHARLDYGPWNCQNCYSRACEHNRGSIYYLIFTKLIQ